MSGGEIREVPVGETRSQRLIRLREKQYQKKRRETLENYGLPPNASREQIKRVAKERRLAMWIVHRLEESDGLEEKTESFGRPPPLDALKPMTEKRGKDFSALLKEALTVKHLLTDRDGIRIAKMFGLELTPHRRSR